MVQVSGPPFGEYPPTIDGVTDAVINGKKVANVFDIKRQIFERESKNFRTLEFYRKTSKKVMSLFSDAQIVGADNEVTSVPIWYANPERAIAKIFQSRNLQLPVMTAAIDATDEDLDRRKPNFNIEFWTVHNKKTRRHTRVASLAPKAVNLTYRLNLWAKYTEDMNQLVEYVEYKFHPHLRVGTTFDEQTYAFLTAISENSVYEAPDREDRVLRKTVTFNLETYMPSRKYMIQSNGDIREMDYEVGIEGVEAATETLVTYPLPTDPIGETT